MKFDKLLLLACFISLLSGCRKDYPAGDCQELKKSLISNNTENIQSLITVYINNLSSQEYSEQNVNALANTFSTQCSISTKVSCFNCIMTLPSATEIQLTFTSDQSTISKVIDISYTPENKMKVVGVHE